MTGRVGDGAGKRQPTFPYRGLAGNGYEMIVNQLHPRKTALPEKVDHLIGKSRGRREGRMLDKAREIPEQIRIRSGTAGLPHRIGHLPADRENGDVLIRNPGCTVLSQGIQDLADHVGIESAAKRGIGSDRDQRDPGALLPAGSILRSGRYRNMTAGRYRRQHPVQSLLIRKHPLNRLLRPVKLGRCDHLHRRGDLEGSADRTDPGLYFLKRRHLTSGRG